MEHFVRWLLENSLKAGVLALMIWALQIIFAKRLTPRWKYFLWSLVALRLVMPNLFPAQFSLFNILNDSKGNPVVLTRSAITPLVSELKSRPAVKAFGAVVTRKRISPWKIFFGLWALGALTLLTMILWRNHRLSSKVVTQRPLTHQPLLDLLEDCKAQMKLHVPVSVVESPLISSPALMGFIRPRLLLPPRMSHLLSIDSMRHVFLHELTHLKRNDIAANWLLTAIQVIYWFNPVAWYVFMRMRAEREQACDQAVLAIIDEKERKDYGLTIINLLASSPGQYPIAGMTGILEDQQQMVKRITMIKNFRIMPVRNVILAVSLLFLLGFFCLSEAQSNSRPVKLDMTQKVLAYLTETGYKKAPMPADDKFNQLYARDFSVENGKIEFTDGVIHTLGHDIFQIHLGRGVYQCLPGGKTEVMSASFDQARTRDLIAYLSDSSVSGKLKKIIIPHLEFEKIPLPNVVEMLEQQSRQFDQQRQGVKINLDPELQQPEKTPSVTLAIDDIALGDVLKYLSKTEGVQYRIEADKVMIVPEGSKTPYEPVSLAKNAAAEWLSLLDDGEYADSWSEASEHLKKGVDVKEWEMKMEAISSRLGKIDERGVKSAAYQTSLPGAPDGKYVVIQYHTSFEKRSGALETITLVQDQDKKWRVGDYTVK